MDTGICCSNFKFNLNHVQEDNSTGLSGPRRWIGPDGRGQGPDKPGPGRGPESSQRPGCHWQLWPGLRLGARGSLAFKLQSCGPNRTPGPAGLGYLPGESRPWSATQCYYLKVEHHNHRGPRRPGVTVRFRVRVWRVRLSRLQSPKCDFRAAGIEHPSRA